MTVGGMGFIPECLLMMMMISTESTVLVPVVQTVGVWEWFPEIVDDSKIVQMNKIINHYWSASLHE